MKRFSLAGLTIVSILMLAASPQAFVQKRTGATAATTSVRVQKAPPAAAAVRRATTPAATATRAAAETITAAQLKEYLYFVAADAMGGRSTPSPGQDETAKFIAAKLQALKLKPAGDDNTYFQRISLRSTKVDGAQTRAAVDGKPFSYGEDFLVAARPGRASGSLVYVGHGWVIKSKNIDAYRGVDVRDKIMIVSGGMPKGITRDDFTDNAGAGVSDPLSYAREHGAKGVVMIPHYPDLPRWWAARRRSMARDRYNVVRFQERDEQEDKSPAALPTIIPSAAMLESLFAGERQNGAAILRDTVAGTPGAAFDLNSAKRLDFTISVQNTTTTTQNIVAVFEGSDPVLKNEYVAIGAHYDHVVGPPVNGDAIYNGADDDGSGTVAMLEIAEAFALGPRPKRSILFVWHTAEEQGLLGSEYFTDYPTVPLQQIIAHINIDMIGRSKKAGDTNPKNASLTGPHEIYVIGSNEMSTELGQLTDRVNRSYLNLNFNYKYDDPGDPNRFFFRSDHYNYARKGIPIVFYFDGVHEDYHQPSDTADKIDYQKMEKVSRTVFMTAAEIANLVKRPTVDKPLRPERMGR